ncbi:universal stress protein UspA [Mesorhizobium sp. Root157]|uniref:universal stress protein n=1 Tax=Mesorhizobium sp. Root157 TaxID=1736477 RepID=UPI0006FED109|nr:universal stress protein [Mesorhizobium sp. Root157]KQZ92778.1 universal stress protein UspA [Mesorhizobium sp. Root157]
MYSHILIATDGSELAQKGVDHGLSLAKALGSKVTVITATDPFPIIYGRKWQPGPQEAKRFEDENREAANQIFSKVKADAEKMGIPMETLHIPNTAAADAILETATDHGCNLIVMSSHGRSGIAKMLLGSQASKVVASSSLPVLVVR